VSAYFHDGRDVGDAAVLADTGAQAGWPSEASFRRFIKRAKVFRMNGKDSAFPLNADISSVCCSFSDNSNVGVFGSELNRTDKIGRVDERMVNMEITMGDIKAHIAAIEQSLAKRGTR
jgi:hypothetical protein